MSWFRRVYDHLRANAHESAILGSLLAAAVGLIVLSGVLPLAYQVLLWGMLLAALLIAGRLFGPVLYYDLMRSSRRLRFIIVRLLYALGLAVVLGWVFLIISLEYDDGKVPPQEMTDIATYMFYTLLSIQFLVVVLLTPAYTAGAIAEEKECKTLEFVLATDLRNGEIIAGKVVSRLLNLTLLLLAGVPIFSLLQFLGGVDFTLVIAGFAVTALTMFSLAGLSILNSATFRRARDAIVMTYLMVIFYYVVAGASLMVYPLSRSAALPGLENFPSTDTWTSPIELGDLVEWLNAGNIVYAIYKLGRGAGATAVLDKDLPGVFGRYALFHGLVGAACLGWAILRLRVLALREVVKRLPRKKGAKGRVRSLPRVGLHPMIWKEIYAEGGLRLNSVGRIIAGVLFLASFLPTIIIFWTYFDDRFRLGRPQPLRWAEVSRAMSAAQMRFVGTTVACMLLLVVVVRAAGSVRSERERNTFDDLLTTPLSNEEILFGKWLGAMLSVRWAWIWLGMIWLICLVTGGVQIYALPLLFATWLTYAAIGAGVGLWFSVGSKSTLRATVAALATMLFICGGHWLVTGLFCYFPLSLLTRHTNEDSWSWLLNVQAGQTPPFVMALFAFNSEDFAQPWNMDFVVKNTISSLFGVGCWAAMLPVLWLLVKRRFEKVTGRAAVLHPEWAAPPRRRAPKKARLMEPARNGEGDEQVVTAQLADESPNEQVITAQLVDEKPDEPVKAQPADEKPAEEPGPAASGGA
jgi:ABC-type transport system involved in multi-copper enzyme maturation permease subunit